MSSTALCLDWHIQNSDAFRDILVTPLKQYRDIVLTPWDGEHISTKLLKKGRLIFCMLPPPQRLLNNPDLQAVWIPMWDQAQNYDDTWWSELPKGLRIVAFSQKVYEKASSHGLPALRLKYYKDPGATHRVTWDQGRVLFYWNRVGMVGPAFIESLCKALQVDTLLFKPDIDPRIEEDKYFELPEKLGNTDIQVIHTTKTRDEFLKRIESANMVLSPRLTEGVGMVYLEAMARGSAIIAHDAPTMNEYIAHGRNGILVSDNFVPLGTKLRKIIRKEALHEFAPFLLTDHQPWNSITKLNPKKLGNQAYEDSFRGYKKWIASWEAYAKFILDW